MTRTAPSILAGSALVALACLLAGCAEEQKSAAALEASELLDLFQKQQQKDRSGHLEVDLGRFRVSHTMPGDGGQLHVGFHLYGILPPSRLEKLEELRPHYENRVRDAVISLVQRSQTEHLLDPSLSYFKEEVVAAINRVLQDHVLDDVVFSDFSTDPSGYASWSSPSAESKPSSHGGGHGH